MWPVQVWRGSAPEPEPDDEQALHDVGWMSLQISSNVLMSFMPTLLVSLAKGDVAMCSAAVEEEDEVEVIPGAPLIRAASRQRPVAWTFASAPRKMECRRGPLIGDGMCLTHISYSSSVHVIVEGRRALRT